MSEKSEIVLDVTPVVEEQSSEVTFGGFKTVEELTAAYEALKTPKEPSEEAKEPLTPEPVSKEIPKAAEGAQKVVEKAGLDWAALNTEYAADGKLSDETYASLEASGLPRSEVDTYIRGKQAEADAYDTAVYGTVGGTEAYTALMHWARDNLSEAEKAAFNDAITSGDAARASLAAEGLNARHAAKRGAPPGSLLKGKQSPVGSAPFQSQVEVTAAMRSPRYKNDPAYRAEVVERLRHSSF